jgi:hypothetical protein
MAELRDDLRAEYAILQTNYEAIDGRVISMKGWLVPLLSAGLGLGIRDHSVALLLATGLACICVWVLEGIWKNFQWCYTDRISLLESVFRNETDSSAIAPFQVHSSWVKSYPEYRSRARLWRTMKRPFVCIPYLPVLVACLVAVIWLLVTPLPA